MRKLRILLVCGAFGSTITLIGSLAAKLNFAMILLRCSLGFVLSILLLVVLFQIISWILPELGGELLAYLEDNPQLAQQSSAKPPRKEAKTKKKHMKEQESEQRANKASKSDFSIGDELPSESNLAGSSSPIASPLKTPNSDDELTQKFLTVPHEQLAGVVRQTLNDEDT